MFVKKYFNFIKYLIGDLLCSKHKKAWSTIKKIGNAKLATY